MKSNEVSRYDLPSSRILIRSLRHAESRVLALAGDTGDAEARARISDQVLDMVRDLFVVRLLEDRHCLRDYYLSGGRRSSRLSAEVAREHLGALNAWAGFELANLSAWSSAGPGEELAQLDYELHLSRFWPPDMPVEILGSLWEERLPAPRRSGVYYTPRRIVDLVLSSALAGSKETKREEDFTLLDPACGSGYFLLEAYRRLLDRELAAARDKGELFTDTVKGESGKTVLSAARRLDLIREHLFGVDIDGRALELARRGFFVEALSDLPALSSPAPDPSALFTNLKEGDSILEASLPEQVDMFEPSPPIPGKPFIWESREEGFGRVLDEGGFNLIVGNPPWVSLKGRHKQSPYSGPAMEYLLSRYSADTYRPNVVEFFIRRGLELLAEGGFMSFVVPDRVAENEQFESLRRHMSEQGEMWSLHFREPFPGVAADTLIYLFHKRAHPRQSVKIAISDATGRALSVPQNYWIKGKGFVPAGTPADDVESVLHQIETAGKKKLSDFLETGVGFIAKTNRITRERVSAAQQPAIKGEHVLPYGREGQAWFEFSLANLAGGTRALRKLAHPNRILLRKTGARLIAARDQTGDLPEQSLYFAFLRDLRHLKNYDLRYFLGILNSRTMSFYFRHRKITNRATTPQIKKVHLDSLPIRPINFNDLTSRGLYEALVKIVGERESAKDPSALRELDRQVDHNVAELYGIPERHLALIAQETAKGWE